MQAFLLGLANGTTCLVYCAPVLIPFLLGEGRKVGQNWGILGQFLGGRLGGYLIFGLLAWAANRLILGDTGYRSLVFSLAYVTLAGLLLFYGLGKAPAACAGSLPRAQGWLRKWPALLPAGLGLLTGLNLCPPFLLALTGAASTPSLAGSLAFFGAFFVGTSVYFLPIPFVGAFRRVQSLRLIGKFTAVGMAVYYLYSGLVLFAGGIS